MLSPGQNQPQLCPRIAMPEGPNQAMFIHQLHGKYSSGFDLCAAGCPAKTGSNCQLNGPSPPEAMNSVAENPMPGVDVPPGFNAHMEL